jgi:glycosyltransferase involved in cell wall biosynthesis
MKIVFVSNGLKVGGAEKFSLNLINGFAECGHQPILILLDNDNPLLKDLNKTVKTYIFKRNFRYDLGVSRKIREVILKEQVKKVICIEIFPFFLAKLFFQRNKNILFYLSLHNSLPISRKQHLFDITYLKTFRKSDVAIFICHYQKKCFREKYHLKPYHSVVIYNGIDVDYFSAERSKNEILQKLFQWKSGLGLKENSRVILMIGRLSTEKDHPNAIAALSYLRKQLNFDAHLVVVGGGPADYLKYLQTRCTELGIGDFVHFTGPVSEVRPYLLLADIFTLTSFSETFSIAALEALSCGTPCSLTNVGGAAEMIGNEEIGILCEPGNPASIAASWKKLLTTSISRAHIAAYTASHFSLQKMMNEYFSLVGN